jgi:hypothetical protein
MVTARAIAGSHAGWIVYARVPVARRLGPFTGDTSARIRLFAITDPWPNDGHRRRDTESGMPPCPQLRHQMHHYQAQERGFERP